MAIWVRSIAVLASLAKWLLSVASVALISSIVSVVCVSSVLGPAVPMVIVTVVVIVVNAVVSAVSIVRVVPISCPWNISLCRKHVPCMLSIARPWCIILCGVHVPLSRFYKAFSPCASRPDRSGFFEFALRNCYLEGLLISSADINFLNVPWLNTYVCLRVYVC